MYVNNESGISATCLRRTFGKVVAVDQVTFEAPRGAITALIGPNGSGKTTLLLMLAGLLLPDSGEARVDGHNIRTENMTVRNAVGWMPDVFGTWDSLTCLEIVTISGRAYGMSRALANQRGRQLLEQMHLLEFANRPARVLSRGQKQRLGLVQTLIHDPQVLLLDEPASGLDPRSRIELRDILRELASTGKTILVSSHVLSELEEVYDFAVFLSRGRTVQVQSNVPTAQLWRVDAIDRGALRAFLDSQSIAYSFPQGWEGELNIALPDVNVAAGLVRNAIAAGVFIHTIAPVGSSLEATYLALNEERI